jgi:hypothetical protein
MNLNRLAAARRGPKRIAIAAAVTVAAPLATAWADVTIPPVTIGAGVQASFYDCDKACIYSPGSIAAGDSNVQGFALNSVRLYVNGGVTDQIKMTFDTEYTPENDVQVLDAIGRFEFSDMFNIWAGRFLPPSDRANLYGPYYADDWTPYADGVADYYPDVAVGRDNGVAYWGQFGILKVQAGAFDGESLNSAVADKSKVLAAGRVMVDFWDPEPGYYLNGTYYGEKDLLSLGLAAQSQDSKTAWNLDGLMEKKLAGAGAITVEAEYQRDNGLTAATSSDGWYGLVAYVFPQVVGVGKFQILGKYSDKTIDTAPSSSSLKTTELNLNYIIKDFNARVGLYYLNQKDDLTGISPDEFGVKMQLQM